MSQYFSRLALRMLSESGICLCSFFRANFALITTLTLDFAHKVVRWWDLGGPMTALWKKLRYLLHPVQDATLSLTSQDSFLSDAFISLLEQKGVGGRAIYPGGDILFKYVIVRGEKRQSLQVWNAKSVGARYFEKTSKWALNKFCCKWVTV